MDEAWAVEKESRMRLRGYGRLGTRYGMLLRVLEFLLRCRGHHLLMFCASSRVRVELLSHDM
jgi:hypothetical protein